MFWLCCVISISHLNTKFCPELAVLHSAETRALRLPATRCSHFKGGAQPPDTCQSHSTVQSQWCRISHSTAVVGYVSKMQLPTLDFVQDCQLILPSHGEKMCRERQQKRNRGGYLTWRSSRLHDRFMSCISPGTSAFSAWKEHFPSLCSCLPMQGGLSHGPSNSLGQAPRQLPWGPTATTFQHLGAWTGLLLWPIPAWYISHDLKKWQSVVLQIHRYITGQCLPKSLGKWSRGMVALSWAKRLKKQLRLWVKATQPSCGIMLTWVLVLLGSLLCVYSLNYQLHIKELTSLFRGLAGVSFTNWQYCS